MPKQRRRSEFISPWVAGLPPDGEIKLDRADVHSKHNSETDYINNGQFESIEAEILSANHTSKEYPKGIVDPVTEGRRKE